MFSTRPSTPIDIGLGLARGERVHQAGDAAAPAMSPFMSSMLAAGLIEMPPVSKQTPLPTKAIGCASWRAAVPAHDDDAARARSPGRRRAARPCRARSCAFSSRISTSTPSRRACAARRANSSGSSTLAGSLTRSRAMMHAVGEAERARRRCVCARRGVGDGEGDVARRRRARTRPSSSSCGRDRTYRRAAPRRARIGGGRRRVGRRLGRDRTGRARSRPGRAWPPSGRRGRDNRRSARRSCRPSCRRSPAPTPTRSAGRPREAGRRIEIERRAALAGEFGARPRRARSAARRRAESWRSRRRARAWRRRRRSRRSGLSPSAGAVASRRSASAKDTTSTFTLRTFRTSRREDRGCGAAESISAALSSRDARGSIRSPRRALETGASLRPGKASSASISCAGGAVPPAIARLARSAGTRLATAL